MWFYEKYDFGCRKTEINSSNVLFGHVFGKTNIIDL